MNISVVSIIIGRLSTAKTDIHRFRHNNVSASKSEIWSCRFDISGLTVPRSKRKSKSSWLDLYDSCSKGYYHSE